MITGCVVFEDGRTVQIFEADAAVSYCTSLDLCEVINELVAAGQMCLTILSWELFATDVDGSALEAVLVSDDVKLSTLYGSIVLECAR